MSISIAARLCAVWRARDEEVSRDFLAKYFVDKEAVKVVEDHDKKINSSPSRDISVRGRYIDEMLREAVLKKGIRQVVNFASGLNTSFYRLKELNELNLFEVDVKEMIDFKENKIKELKKREIFSNSIHNVKFVEGDLFSPEEIWGNLYKQDYDKNSKTFFILEGIVYYLPKEILAKNLNLIAKNSCSRSLLIVNYWQKEMLNNKKFQLMASYLGNLNEKLVNLINKYELGGLLKNFTTIKNLSNSECEKLYCRNLQLINPEKFIPYEILLAERD